MKKEFFDPMDKNGDGQLVMRVFLGSVSTLAANFRKILLHDDIGPRLAVKTGCSRGKSTDGKGHGRFSPPPRRREAFA